MFLIDETTMRNRNQFHPGAYDDNGGYWHPAPVRWLPLALAFVMAACAAALAVLLVMWLVKGRWPL